MQEQVKAAEAKMMQGGTPGEAEKK